MYVGIEGSQRHNLDRRRVCTYIIATENTNDFAVTVELAEDPLLHVLQKRHVSYDLRLKLTRKAKHALTFFNSG